MSGKSINLIRYKGWENCIHLTNDIIEIIVTTDVGPRIIYFGFSGKHNELCELQEDSGAAGDNQFRLYGGHRLWHSPEEFPRTYEPDNFKVEWKETDNGVLLLPSINPWTQIKKEIEIDVSPSESNITVNHRLTNKGPWPVQLSVWALTMMAAGGVQIIPMPQKDTGLLPNRSIALWPYTAMNDSRVSWGEKYIILNQDPGITLPFKIGLPNEYGRAAYINNGHLFIKQFEHIHDAPYPDFGSSYETYTNELFMEMETLSPLRVIPPEESIEHSESWTLHEGFAAPQNENEIDSTIGPLLKK